MATSDSDMFEALGYASFVGLMTAVAAGLWFAAMVLTRVLH